MKIVRGLAIFLISTIIFGSCFDPPQFPAVPEIDFEKLVFIDDPGPVDALVLYLTFKDGDGDLGLDAENLDHISYPYNDVFFFQEDGNGGMDSLATVAGRGEAAFFDILVIPDPSQGDLVSFRTRKKSGYEDMPAYHCSHYEVTADGPPKQGEPPKPTTGRKLLIAKADTAALGPSIKIVDSLTSEGQVFYQIMDTLMYQSNPNHYNIEVDFLIKNPGHPDADNLGFVEFDWEKEEDNCESFDARFPILSDKDNSLEGTLTYSMESRGFKKNLSLKTFKLRFKIKDRALHESRAIETPAVTLDMIRK